VTLISIAQSKLAQLTSVQQQLEQKQAQVVQMLSATNFSESACASIRLEGGGRPQEGTLQNLKQLFAQKKATFIRINQRKVFYINLFLFTTSRYLVTLSYYIYIHR
jgi:hypothetical protein